MTDPKVIIVVLRQPRRSEPDEKRTDPLWEFGSFGLTTCKKRSLLHPNNIDDLAGARLAFAQGGELGFKLVYLTSPVTPVRHVRLVEARWSSVHMPFKYKQAPLLINNDDESDFPLLKKFIMPVNCHTGKKRFASKFRSCKTPLDPDLAAEVIRVFEQKFDLNNPDLIAATYVEALPYSPPCIDTDREQTYHHLLAESMKGYNP